jgi:hypothetical protein
MWREGLGAYKILTEGKKGYSNHPAVKEFSENHLELKNRLWLVRQEMLKRGYHPKPLPDARMKYGGEVKEWQTLEEQIEVLRAKGCKCNIKALTK